LHLGRCVNQRERWQALQQHLKFARAAMEAGERAAALQHADAALALDPAFLAAQTLHERIVAMGAVPSAVARPSSAVAAAEVPQIAAPVAVATVLPTEPRRQAPDLAQFEARARQRRLEKRVAAARQGLAAGRLADARAAIDEITELDPAHPTLRSLLEALDAAERERVIAFVERELPLRPSDQAPDLPLGLPATPDLPLAVTAVTPEPAVIPASEAPNDPIVIASAGTLPSDSGPQVGAAADHQVVAIEPLTETILPSRDAQQRARPRRRHSRLAPWLAATAAFAAVVFAAPWFERSAPSDGVGEPAPIEVAVTAPPVVPTSGADAAAIDATLLPDPSPLPDDAARPDASLAAAPPAGSAVTNAAAGEPGVPPTAINAITPADSPLVRPVAIVPQPLPAAPSPAAPSPSPTPADTVASVPPPVAPPAAPPQARPEPSPALGISTDVPRQLAVAPIPAPPVAAAARPAASPSAAANVPPRPDDMQLVRDALQQYRSAYQDLSAERAHAIWPEVNEAALQRAFQALESQTLTFDACDVQLRGSSATATCRGTTQYVPKVGSREPRTEPRVWNFTLQKAGEGWQIETARTQR
jgi:hypothetical protein